jgi:hypothetical protein
MKKLVLTGGLLLVSALPLISGAQPKVIESVAVWEEPGRFGGWPANHGIWSWGNEIVVGFSAAHFKLGDLNHHLVDRDKPGVTGQARSMDGGRTWKFTEFTSEPGGSPVDLREPMDFTQRDFAMKFQATNADRGPARFYYSIDRGHHWRGPYRFPLFDLKGVPARTDYIVNGKRDCMVLLTATKSNGHEGRPFCARTRDGGLTWKFVSFIGPEPEGFAIMPSTVRLGRGVLITAVRHKEASGNWLDGYRSEDDGVNWRLLGKIAPTGDHSGNPPSLLRLRDGRLVVIYGYRSAPYGIRASFSTDNGVSWGEEFGIRPEGPWWDLGYPRSVQRPDGKIVTVYYFMRAKDTERYIAATIWDPGEWRGGKAKSK